MVHNWKAIATRCFQKICYKKSFVCSDLRTWKPLDLWSCGFQVKNSLKTNYFSKIFSENYSLTNGFSTNIYSVFVNNNLVLVCNNGFSLCQFISLNSHKPSYFLQSLLLLLKMVILHTGWIFMKVLPQTSACCSRNLVYSLQEMHFPHFLACLAV